MHMALHTYMWLHTHIVTTGTGSTSVHTSYNLNVTHVCHACVDHEIHIQFCYMHLNSCICSYAPRTHGKNMSYMCTYRVGHQHSDTTNPQTLIPNPKTS